jgi:glutathione peroxidase
MKKRSNPFLAPLAVMVAALSVGCRADAPSPGATSVVSGSSAPSAPSAAVGSFHDLSARRLGGEVEPLRAYAGKVVLVVNTASECGYTPQYEGLQKLFDELSGKGLVVLGFPSNDFGGQEPGSSQEIASFCSTKFGVRFPMFEKVVTRGEAASPVYRWLATGAGEPKWNFHKYLVDRSGRLVRAFPSGVTPESAELRAAIEAELAR